MDEQLEFLLWLAERLDGAGIPYMVTGSVALAVYGAPRMTRDIDVVVEIDSGSADTIVELLSRLIWGRASGSELQERDVRDLLEAVDDLDLEYLQHWASQLGVSESLERLRES